MSFWPFDGILFQEHPFSSSSSNHLIWQRFNFPLYLCSVTEMSWWKRSPYSSLTPPQFNGKKSMCENKKCIFSDMLPSSYSYESTRTCASFLKFAALKFPRKPLENVSKDCYDAFSLSLNTASNSLSLKVCLIWGPINT